MVKNTIYNESNGSKMNEISVVLQMRPLDAWVNSVHIAPFFIHKLSGDHICIFCPFYELYFILKGKGAESSEW